MKIIKLGRGFTTASVAIFVLICVVILFSRQHLQPILTSGSEFREYHVSETRCVTGTPCVYDDEVDFRVIVITYNRAESLLKLLRTLDEVVLDGDKGALEIWIDRNKEGRVRSDTVQVANSFKWKRGTTRVHVQNAHAGIYGQWIDTWRPKDNESKELALILEDDISVSKYIYRWIKGVHRFYAKRSDFAGTSLTSDELNSLDGSYTTLKAPKTETVFMYKCIGTWGFSPKQAVWKGFQDWYHVHIKRPDFHPYVPGILPTEWYKDFERKGAADSMWEMWFIYYAHKEKLSTIYNNLKEFNGDLVSCLCINRREVGLHVGSKGRDDYCKILDRWDDKFITLTPNITKLDWSGKIIVDY